MENVIYQEIMNNLEYNNEFTVVRNTGAKLTMDGNQFCYLIGEDLQSGIAGFGDTAYEAMCDLNNNFHNFKTTSSKGGE